MSEHDEQVYACGHCGVPYSLVYCEDPIGIHCDACYEYFEREANDSYHDGEVY